MRLFVHMDTNQVFSLESPIINFNEIAVKRHQPPGSKSYR